MKTSLCYLLAAALLALLLVAPNVAAADTSPAVALPAAFWNDILGNRTRMIQVGVIFVVIGILFLMRSPK